MSDLTATPANMRRAEHIPGVFALNPLTGERFSATAGDYFAQRDDAPLTGEQGETLVLAIEHSEIVPLDERCEVPARISYAPNVTDTNEDGTPAYTFEPWTDGHALGFRVTRHADGKVSYVYLNPSTDTSSDERFHPDVFVYTGTHGDPARDSSHHFYNIDFEEAE